MITAAERLERIANIAIVFAAICCAGAWTWYATRPRVVALPSVRYSVGDSFANVNELRAALPRRTMLVLVSSTCRYCSESMPVYRNVLSDEAVARWRVVFASRDEPGVLKHYLENNGLPIQNVDLIRISDTSEFKATATPLLFLLDTDSRIQQTWEGKLTPDREAAVRRALHARPATADSGI